MKLSSLVAVATTALATLFSGVDAQQPVSGFYPVRGPAFFTNGAVVRRLPLQFLASDRPDIYNMFLLALIDMQTNKAETDPISYYQISGIHGVPFLPWQETSVATQDDSTGYCTHTSVLFATWHRPFLALFEERLVKHAIYVASKFTGTSATRYRRAARNVRLPYWDWAANDLQSRMPTQLYSTTVTVTRPGAGGVPQTVTVANPLREYAFTNQALRAQWMGDGDFGLTSRTRRQPPPDMQSSNNAAVNTAMNQGFTSRRNAVFNLFTIPNFSDFSGTQLNTNGSPNAWNSVESIHNSIHVHIGGQRGHMTAVAYSAFDPIFWLHHCNVDRLVALYQAVNPGRVVEPRPAAGTFHRRVPNGSNLRDTIDTPLAPFRHATGTYFTSRDVSDVDSCWNFGYSYPETPVEFRGNPTGLRSFASAEINRLYGSGSGSAKRANEHKRREWICHMTYDIGELKDSSMVAVYFDKPPSNGTVYPTAVGTASSPVSTGISYANRTYEGPISKDAYYVGSTASLKDPKHVMKMNTAGAVYLSDALLEAGCKSLDPEDVVPFLKERLRWVVTIGGYTEVPLKDLPSLKVGISSAEVEYPEDETKLPTYGKFVTHYDVTENRQCGFTHKDEDLVDSDPAKPVSNTVVSLLPTYMRPKPTYVPEEPVDEEPTYPEPTYAPEEPTYKPTYVPEEPTYAPEKPTYKPTYAPEEPTYKPTYAPEEPTYAPEKPNYKPTYAPEKPTYKLTYAPEEPTYKPTATVPTYEEPTDVPTYLKPTEKPTDVPVYGEPAATSTKVYGGVTTVIVKTYTTVCPATCEMPITTAFTAIYPDEALPTYSVF